MARQNRRGLGKKFLAGSDHLRRLDIGRASGMGKPSMPEAASFPIFLHVTMPQVPSPDIGEGSRCGRFRVCLPTVIATQNPLASQSMSLWMARERPWIRVGQASLINLSLANRPDVSLRDCRKSSYLFRTLEPVGFLSNGETREPADHSRHERLLRSSLPCARALSPHVSPTVPHCHKREMLPGSLPAVPLLRCFAAS